MQEEPTGLLPFINTPESTFPTPTGLPSLHKQVYLPYINTPECIIGAHGALISINGKDWAAEIIRKNPGVLACNPKTLATVSLSTVTPSRKPHDGHALS